MRSRQLFCRMLMTEPEIWVTELKCLPSRPDSPSLASRTNSGKRSDTPKLSSDQHTHNMSCPFVTAHVIHTHIQINNTKDLFKKYPCSCDYIVICNYQLASPVGMKEYYYHGLTQSQGSYHSFDTSYLCSWFNYLNEALFLVIYKTDKRYLTQ